MITQTDDVAAALAEAKRRWPDLSDTELLYRLIAEGYQAMRRDPEARRARILAGAGALAGTYEPGYLEKLREDWPE
ncbi:hypothetical protein GCM10023321_20490 [Pseudonocardia eucalypti]|uniref:CopG family transcriptional regulator n=1 Tax=Pseudonocardia eucalypti TaxID=648755 RepID=A0ABP9PU74_9PSEU|nr:hypothetical protein [Pseudonocardia eucalypti]